jgi:hypothetical protein
LALAVTNALALFAAASSTLAQSTATTPPGSAADAEWRAWQAEGARVAKERQAAERARLEPVAARMRETDDRAELEQLITHLQSAPSLEPSLREELLPPLLNRQLQLLARDVTAALQASDLDTSQELLVAALQALQARRDAVPAEVLRTLAAAQAAHVDTAVTQADVAARAGDTRQAQTLLERARAVAPSSAHDPEAGKRADERLAQGHRALAEASVAATLAQGREAEQRRDLRRALSLYRSAADEGADVSADFARIEAQRRTPLLEGGMSTIVPGLGQVTHGRPLVGGLFFAGTGVAILGGVLLNASAESRYDQYQAATDPAAAARRYDGINARWRGALVLFGAAAILHVWNIYDAYADARSFNLANFH